MKKEDNQGNGTENYCPSCGEEVNPSDAVCPKCGAELGETVALDEDKERTVVIKTYSSEFEAELAKAQLEDEGIDCFLENEDEGALSPNLQFTQGVRLAVLESNAEKALQILNAFS